MKSTQVILGMMLIGLFGCAVGPCPKSERLDTAMTATDTRETVFVYKEDGSRQCEPESGVSVDKMALEFGAMKVFSAKSLNDGKMRIQMCGSPTGQCNVYEILKSDAEKARALGFKPWVAAEDRTDVF